MRLSATLPTLLAPIHRPQPARPLAPAPRPLPAPIPSALTHATDILRMAGARPVAGTPFHVLGAHALKLLPTGGLEIFRRVVCDDVQNVRVRHTQECDARVYCLDLRLPDKVVQMKAYEDADYTALTERPLRAAEHGAPAHDLAERLQAQGFHAEAGTWLPPEGRGPRLMLDGRLTALLVPVPFLMLKGWTAPLDSITPDDDNPGCNKLKLTDGGRLELTVTLASEVDAGVPNGSLDNGLRHFGVFVRARPLSWAIQLLRRVPAGEHALLPLVRAAAAIGRLFSRYG